MVLKSFCFIIYLTQDQIGLIDVIINYKLEIMYTTNKEQRIYILFINYLFYWFFYLSGIYLISRIKNNKKKRGTILSFYLDWKQTFQAPSVSEELSI